MTHNQVKIAALDKLLVRVNDLERQIQCVLDNTPNGMSDRDSIMQLETVKEVKSMIDEEIAQLK